MVANSVNLNTFQFVLANLNVGHEPILVKTSDSILNSATQLLMIMVMTVASVNCVVVVVFVSFGKLSAITIMN